MRHLLVFLLLSPTLPAGPLAGARETFTCPCNAEAWSLYSYNDGIVAPPAWIDPDNDDNPYAYSYFLGGKGFWFFADNFTPQGAFVSDYAAKKISGVDVSVSVDPSEINYIDLVAYADGPNGLRCFL